MDKVIYALKQKEYQDGVTLLTPTGDRHLCFQRLEGYIANQTYSKALQWIVIDDGKIPTPCQYKQTYIRNVQGKGPGCCPHISKSESLTGNILAALPHVTYDKILIIEDDDYYGPKYIETMAMRLFQVDLVGETHARYYNVASRQYRVNGNTKSASFCQTALSSRIIDALYVSCLKQSSAFIDARLWNKNVKKRMFGDVSHCVGIKGMPGRQGIGIGHRPNSASFKSDKNAVVLYQWLPKDDADFYAQFYKPQK